MPRRLYAITRETPLVFNGAIARLPDTDEVSEDGDDEYVSKESRIIDESHEDVSSWFDDSDDGYYDGDFMEPLDDYDDYDPTSGPDSWNPVEDNEDCLCNDEVVDRAIISHGGRSRNVLLELAQENAHRETLRDIKKSHRRWFRHRNHQTFVDQKCVRQARLDKRRYRGY